MKTDCCNYYFVDDCPVYWNPYNKVVQCHNCGEVFEPKSNQLDAYKQGMTDAAEIAINPLVHLPQDQRSPFYEKNVRLALLRAAEKEKV